MKFTHYYSNLIKAKGIPQLTISQYQKIFNIIILETRIDETNKLLKSNIDSNTKIFLNKRNYNLYSKLYFLTQGKKTDRIIRDLIDLE